MPLPRVADWSLTALFLVYAGLSALLYGSLFLGGFVRVWGIDHRLTTVHYRDIAAVGLPVLAAVVLPVERFGRRVARPGPSVAA